LRIDDRIRREFVLTNKKKLSPEYYAYVSLFGVASISDLRKQAKSANKVVASSGNVFADLGPDAAELDTKVASPPR
jgi:hypothetical protein